MNNERNIETNETKTSKQERIMEETNETKTSK